MVDKKVGKLAVVRLGGKQYKVQEGQEFLVDKLSDKAAPEVLLVFDGEKTQVGKPLVDKAKVQVSVVSELEKGEKVSGFKYKAKSRYRKRFGFRAQYTRLKVDKITS